MPENTRESAPLFQDDSVLAGAAQQVMADINRFFSKERLERAAMSDERVRLARDLHDGMLQSLSGAVLQLEALSRLIDEDPKAARKRLREIGDLIADEQRELRTWIEKLKPTSRTSMASSADLNAALKSLCYRVELRWGLQTTLTTGPGSIPRLIGDEVYHLVQEAITNVARHARAQHVDVGVQITHDRVRVTVEDDGVGFPFRGKYDLAILVERGLGPKSLQERIAALGGELVLTSALSGSKLVMELPLPQGSGK